MHNVTFENGGGEIFVSIITLLRINVALIFSAHKKIIKILCHLRGSVDRLFMTVHLLDSKFIKMEKNNSLSGDKLASSLKFK